MVADGHGQRELGVQPHKVVLWTDYIAPYPLLFLLRRETEVPPGYSWMHHSPMIIESAVLKNEMRGRENVGIKVSRQMDPNL